MLMTMLMMSALLADVTHAMMRMKMMMGTMMMMVMMMMRIKMMILMLVEQIYRFNFSTKCID